MDNGDRVEWSARAANDFNQIIRYLSEKWNKREIRKFVQQIDKSIHHIRKFPLLFPATLYHSELRRCVISKIHTLYYLIQDNTIYLVAIWDNRRDFQKLQNFLKREK